MRTLGGENTSTRGSVPVRGKRNERQGVESEPEKLLDHGGLHGKGIIHKGESKAKLNLGGWPGRGRTLRGGFELSGAASFTLFEAVRKLGVMGVRDPFGIFLFGWTAALRNQEVRRLGC